MTARGCIEVTDGATGVTVDFACTVQHLHGIPVVLPTGAVDIESAPQLAARLIDVALGASDRVVLDLAGVSFFDSAGLGALDQAQTAAAGTGTTISLVCREPRILRLLEITGLTDRFVIASTLERAVE